MGYEFTCSIPMAVGAALAIVLGLFIVLARLRDWAAKLINKKRRVIVVAYKAGRQYKYYFATVKDAAAYAIKRRAKGIAYIEADGKTVWSSSNEENAKRKLEELGK